MVSLDELKIGEKAIIEIFETENLPFKLIEMGCLPGSSIEIIQKALLNDPLYIKIDESYFCLLYTSPSPRDVEESRMPSSA